MAMMAMTTKSSINVKAARRGRERRGFMGTPVNKERELVFVFVARSEVNESFRQGGWIGQCDPKPGSNSSLPDILTRWP